MNTFPDTTIIQGDSLATLKQLPDSFVQCCITSPPYWGLRDYGTAQWEGGDPNCDHQPPDEAGQTDKPTQGQRTHAGRFSGPTCHKCGATRIDSQLGLEKTPEEYVQKLVAIFREVRRVLRDDGVLFLNLASSYCSEYIESHEYVIRNDIAGIEKQQAMRAIASAMQMRAFQAPSKQNVPGVPQNTGCQAGELLKPGVSMRQGVPGSQGSSGEGLREVLQQVVCEIGESDTQEKLSPSDLSNVQQTVQQISRRNQKEQGIEALLQRGLLVRVQPEGQPLPMAGGTARTNEPGRREVETKGSGKGSEALSHMSFNEETGSSPHSSIQHSPRDAMGCSKRGDSVPHMPRQVSSPRTRICRDVDFHCIGPSSDLESMTIPKNAIPSEVLHLFRPRHIIKPKDDVMIPAAVAFALRADGWFLRSDLIWAKGVSGQRETLDQFRAAMEAQGIGEEQIEQVLESLGSSGKQGLYVGNPMPSSVQDRCTTSHEYVFMFTKKARYFYDNEAVKEGTTDSSKSRLSQPTLASQEGSFRAHAGEKSNGSMKAVGDMQSRNRRSVWTIPTKSFKESHFAVYPPDLIRPMIRAGTSEKGCCPACAAPWKRLIEKDRKATRPGTDSKVYVPDPELKQDAAAPAGSASERTYTGFNARWKDAKEIGNRDPQRHVTSSRTIGWEPTCTCVNDNGQPHEPIPCLVLDPFSGAATTGVVCLEEGREYIGLELNAEYIAMSEKRLEDTKKRIVAEREKAARKAAKITAKATAA